MTEAFRRFQNADPAPKGELQYVNPFTLLVAVVLSAQATDAGVNKATPALFALADTPEKMVRLGEDQGARSRSRPSGSYRNKAKNMIALVRKADRRAWRRGAARARGSSKRCPASAARPRMSCSTWRSASRPWRSTRMCFASRNRTGLAPGKNPLEVELRLVEVIPAEYMMHAHHWLILHGRYTCLARKPLCEKCIIADLCHWPGKTCCACASEERSCAAPRSSTRVRPDSFLCMMHHHRHRRTAASRD